MYRILLLLSWLLLSGCEKALFHPDSYLYRTPDAYQLQYEEHCFDAADGTKLHGWWLKPATVSKGLMVVAHGNAQNISSHFTGWVWLVKAGYELFIYDYRGFGASGGSLGLAEAVSDTQRAMHYAAKRYRGDKYLCGESIGGLLVINALSRESFDNYRFAIIHSGMSDLQELGREVMARGWLSWPFQWLAYPLLSDEYDPIDKLGDVSVPLLFVAGSADRVIPANHSWQLFDAAKRPKEFWLVPGAGHIGAFESETVQRELLDYLEHYPDASKPSTMKIFDNFDRITPTNTKE